MQKTFVMIKPCGIPHKDEILRELDKHGKRVMTAEIEKLPKEIIEEHYASHKTKSFYEDTVNYFVGKPTVVAVYEGVEIVEKFKEITGPTEPKEGTLRGKYVRDTYAKANKEKRPVLNAIHRSGSAEEAEREIEIWKVFFN